MDGNLPDSGMNVPNLGIDSGSSWIPPEDPGSQLLALARSGEPKRCLSGRIVLAVVNKHRLMLLYERREATGPQSPRQVGVTDPVDRTVGLCAP